MFEKPAAPKPEPIERWTTQRKAAIIVDGIERGSADSGVVFAAKIDGRPKLTRTLVDALS